MDALFDRLFIDSIADVSTRQVLAWAMQNFYAFTLVLVRMSGLMAIGPIFGQRVVPTNVRILLVVTMSLLVAPTLGNQSRIAFRRLDVNHDRLLTRDEIPQQLEERFSALLDRAGKFDGSGLLPGEFHYSLELPQNLLDYVLMGVGEFSLGLVLGLGVLIVLTGLQVAGELIDQQTGLSLGEIANPAMEINGSITGQFLFMLGVTILLVMEPFGGHLLMISSLVETFQTLPVGDAYVTTSAVDLLRDLVHRSLVMGIQIAAPLLATMSLVALTMGFLGHSVPQVNVLIIGFPIRAVVSLLILAIGFSGVGRAVVDSVPVAIDNIRHALTAL